MPDLERIDLWMVQVHGYDLSLCNKLLKGPELLTKGNALPPLRSIV